MPAYEYHCQACDHVFTVYMSFSEHDTGDVRCPECKGTEVNQVVSSFVAVTSKKS